jgi:hypothetical protein
MQYILKGIFSSLILIAGCAKPSVKYDASLYPKVLKQWTKKDRIFSFDTFDNIMFVTATYRSWEFRKAYIAKYAKDFRLPKEEIKKLEQTQFKEGRLYHEFYLAVFCSEPKWNDLDKEDSIWRVSLLSSKGKEIRPLQIKGFRKIKATEISFFPYTTEFRKVYYIKFPKRLKNGRPFLNSKDSWFMLRIAGTLGVSELKWKLK